ncbi:MAG: CapA family protein [Clostridia bacterium]|nr:CapA family protein [Clostridia bacterium]
MTKKKQKINKAALRRRRTILTYMSVFAFVFICVGSMICIGAANGRQTTQANQQWIVEDSGMEILGAPNTLESRRSGSDNDNGGLPFMQQDPTEAPTAAPTPTAKPTAEPTAKPTEVPATPEPVSSDRTVTITAAGDCTLGGDVPSGNNRNFIRYYDNYGPDYFFANVRALFEEDDLTIINLEGPLTTSTDKAHDRTFNFRGDPSYVNILTGSSIEICNIANNHALDYGKKGMNETIDVLRNAGIGVSGFTTLYDTVVNGVRVRSVGFTEWRYSKSDMVKAVRYAKQDCDILIVSMHWGEERVYTQTATQKNLGHALIDAGADVILGTHPHVYGGVEQYNGKYIVYSLGNFCFGGNKNPRDKDCLIFRQTFIVSDDGTVSDGGIDLIPASVSGSDSTNTYQPRIQNDDRGKRLLCKVAGVSPSNLPTLNWSRDSFPVQMALVA